MNQQVLTRHPWEIVRADFIIKNIKALKPNRVVDIGSGDGFLGAEISRALECPVLYIDSNFSSEDLSKPNHFQSISEIIPLEGDLILLADVLEHIDRPEDFLHSISRHFHSDSWLLITVPAFQGLFSEHDRFLGHFRRYNKKLLSDHLTRSLKVYQMRYFFVLPLIVRGLQILLGNGTVSKSVSNWKYQRKDLRTIISVILLKLDLYLGFLPGLSLLAIGRTKK